MNSICLNERDAKGRIIVENIITGEKKALTQEQIDKMFPQEDEKK